MSEEPKTLEPKFPRYPHHLKRAIFLGYSDSYDLYFSIGPEEFPTHVHCVSPNKKNGEHKVGTATIRKTEYGWKLGTASHNAYKEALMQAKTNLIEHRRKYANAMARLFPA